MIKTANMGGAIVVESREGTRLGSNNRLLNGYYYPHASIELTSGWKVLGHVAGPIATACPNYKKRSTGTDSFFVIREARLNRLNI